MLIVPQPIRRDRRKRRMLANGEPTPPALTLVAALYEEGTWVRLTFDRAIDISGFDATKIFVNDGPMSGTRWRGADGTMVNSTTVQVELEPDEPSASAEITLDASAANGIVAAEDGVAWVGVTNFPVDG